MTYIIFILALNAVWYYCKIEYYSRGYKDGLDDASNTLDDLLKKGTE